MNRTARWLRNGLGLLLLLALAAGAAWLIVQSRPRPPQVAQTSPLPTPTVPPASPASPTALPPSPSPGPTPRPPGPPPLPTPAAGRVPLCIFPGVGPPERGGPGLDKYEFSEPRVILTSTVGIEIADWLPDNNRLLVTRIDPQTQQERIETLDTRTGELHLHAQRGSHYGKPVWLSAIQGVAYVDIPALNGKPRPLRPNAELRIGRTGAVNPEIIAITEDSDGVLEFSLAADPSGRHLWYLLSRTAGRLRDWDSIARMDQTTVFDVNSWQPRQPDSTQALWQYMVIPLWSPSNTRLAVFVGPGSLFLVEPGPNRVCEVNLGGRWPKAELTQWSPNAHYLAIIASTEEPDPLIRSTDLVVLDVLTGELRRLPLSTKRDLVTTIAWGANSQHLAVLAKTSSGTPYAKLFLVDVVTGDVRPMLSEYTFGSGASWGQQMAWARNGRTLALECPALRDAAGMIVQSGVCLVSTETRP